MPDTTAPEQRTIDIPAEDVRAEGNRLRGHAAVFNALSSDLGGYKERIAPGAFAGVLGADVRLLVNHKPDHVLARTKSGTLRLSEDATGLAIDADLPDTSYARDLRESLRRGDLDGMSFRFTVDQDEWGTEDGSEVRTVKRVKSLEDVCLATYPAYPSASVELRTRPEPVGNPTPDTTTGASERQEDAPMSEQRNDDQTTTEERTEDRAGAGLQLEDRAGTGGGSLIRAFEAQGWPREPAAIPWSEYRTASFTGTVDTLNPVRAPGVGLGQDIRYAYPAFPQVAVEADVTSVAVLRQSARTLPDASAVVRDLDAITQKPEVGTVTEVVTVPLQQVAGIQSGIPNYILEQAAIEPLIATDLRLALNEGLDRLILQAVAGSGFQAPGTDPLLVSIRKAITAIQAEGYSPDTVVLRPADAELLDTLRATPDAAEQFYVGEPFAAAPRSVFGLNVRISKTVPAPVVADSRALGKLYISPVELARFEENAGGSNTSTVRLEGHAAFGVERQDAAVRIAAA